MHGWTFDIERVANAANNGLEDLLHIFFEITETSRALGREYVQRAFSRTEGGDKPNGPEVARAQYDAIVEWGIPDSSQLNRLAGITQPTLVANGNNDTMIPTVNSQLLADHLPNARLRIYPDAAHGFLFQYPRQFAESMRYVRAYPTDLPVLRELLPTIQTPVRIISGSRDTAVPSTNGQFLHDRLRHSTHDIVDSGHFVWEEASDTYASLLTDWWRRH